MDLHLSPAILARIEEILSGAPLTAMQFADRYWADKASQPASQRSRRAHGLLGGLQQQGLVRRIAQGGPAYDVFVLTGRRQQVADAAATSTGGVPATPIGGGLSLGAEPVEGVEHDAAGGSVRLRAVDPPSDCPDLTSLYGPEATDDGWFWVTDRLRAELPRIIRAGRDDVAEYDEVPAIVLNANGQQVKRMETGYVWVRVDQAARILWLDRQRRKLLGAA